MNNSETMIHAIQSYYSDLNLYQFHSNMLNDTQVDLSDAHLRQTEANANRYKDQALQTLGYIKMRFLKDMEDAPQSMKELWGE